MIKKNLFQENGFEIKSILTFVFHVISVLIILKIQNADVAEKTNKK